MLGDAIAVPALVQISDVQSKPNSYDFLVLTEWREEAGEDLPFSSVLDGMKRKVAQESTQGV